MKAIYTILLASFLFKIATSLSSDFEKADFYTGLLFLISIIAAIASAVFFVMGI